MTNDAKQYGVVGFRKTCLMDEGHIAFARQFGELDDVKPYITAGRQHRLNHYELFDVSNVGADGSILDPDSVRGQANKVVRISLPCTAQPIHTIRSLSNLVMIYIGK